MWTVPTVPGVPGVPATCEPGPAEEERLAQLKAKQKRRADSTSTGRKTATEQPTAKSGG